MTDPSLIALFVRPLTQLRIPYVITGGVASVISMGKSDRHLRDIREMLRISRDLMNVPELEGWAARVGVEREWATALDA